MVQERRVATSPDNLIKCEHCGEEFISVEYKTGLCQKCYREYKELVSEYQMTVEEMRERVKELNLEEVTLDSFKVLYGDG